MTTIGSEVQIGAGPKPALAFNELAADNPHLFALLAVHVFGWPLRSRLHVNDPHPCAARDRQIASKAARPYLERLNVIRRHCLWYFYLHGAFVGGAVGER
jgi:hypothetical protein